MDSLQEGRDPRASAHIRRLTTYHPLDQLRSETAEEGMLRGLLHQATNGTVDRNIHTSILEKCLSQKLILDNHPKEEASPYDGCYSSDPSRPSQSSYLSLAYLSQ